MENKEKIKGLYGILQESILKKTEKERILSILDCIKGYKSEYGDNQKLEQEGFIKCKREFNSQIQKIKEFIDKNI